MFYKHYLILLILPSFLMAGGCASLNPKCNEWEISTAINLLADKEHGDNAYEKLIECGMDAIPFLINNRKNDNIFHGSEVYNHLSSLLIDKPAVGIVSMYLVDCIILEDKNPHLGPLISSSENKFTFSKNEAYAITPNVNFMKAAFYYHQWWERNKNTSKSQIKKESPLANTELSWW